MVILETIFVGFWNILFNVSTTFCNFLMAPINAIISQAFPDFSQLVADFYVRVDSFTGPIIWAINIIPPNTRTMLVFYVSMLIIFYTATYGVHGIIKIIEIVKNLWPF